MWNLLMSPSLMSVVPLSLDIVHADGSKPQLNQVFCDFAIAILGKNIDFAPCSTIGVLRDGVVKGVIVFHDWRPEYGTVEITGAGVNPSWCSKRVVKEIYRVCFTSLNANQIVARCDAANLTTTRIFKALGFNVVALPNMRGPDRDELFFYITRNEWNNTRFAQ